jgi:acetylornithine deacetylase
MKQNQRLFDHLAQMVAIPSVSLRSNEAIAAYVANYFEHLGFEITHFKAHPDAGQSNVIARIGPKGAPGLVLSGHMDVVPTKDQPWHFDPFKLTSYDNKLYGRGAVDMKGFIASAMVALRNIKPQDYQKELILIWTYDEETGCLGSKLLSDNVASLQGPLPEKCLIGEPTDCKMICKHNGIVTFKIELKGKAAHSSQPSWGINTMAKSLMN